MKKIRIRTSVKKMLADVYTPVAIYLRLRDRFRDTILLESADHHAAGNSWSFIGIHAIGGIEIRDSRTMEVKFPGRPAATTSLVQKDMLHQAIWNYMQRFEFENSTEPGAGFAQGLYGYISYDALQLMDHHNIRKEEDPIPLARYRLYQYVIAVNHFSDELFLLENEVEGWDQPSHDVEQLIRHMDVPLYPFQSEGAGSNMTDASYRQIVEQAIAHCHRGDVFQLVLSRRFRHAFSGDEFNVYRALRSINPSPYLFYFDYGDYRLMGSSPEAQLVIQQGRAMIHPIAGTIKRTGEEQEDARRANELLNDPKENAEHVMLVDLARNDLSRICTDVQVSRFREVQYYSHVIHLVSEVTGRLEADANPFEVLSKTFPAGTLSGAPKFKAVQLINQYEPSSRGFYGGAIGFVGFNGSCNHAIMIRTLLSRDGHLVLQAGAGIVAASEPEKELQEVNQKLEALNKAINMAATLK